MTAWGGAGIGTTAIPGSQWRSYLFSSNHPEYPSASAGMCSAFGGALALHFDSDDLGLTLNFPKGSSVIEPGVTPAQDITVTFASWSEWVMVCGDSRVWGGLHFEAAVPAGREIGAKVAAIGHTNFQELLGSSAAVSRRQRRHRRTDRRERSAMR